MPRKSYSPTGQLERASQHVLHAPLHCAHVLGLGNMSGSSLMPLLLTAFAHAVLAHVAATTDKQ